MPELIPLSLSPTAGIRTWRTSQPRAVALIVLATLGHTGCQLGPNYARPALETPADFRFQAARPADTALQSEWWRGFGDEQLDRLVAQALEKNQDLGVALARLDEARAVFGVARADLFPRLSAEGGYTRSELSRNTTPRPLDNGAFDEHRLVAGVNWEIDLWGRVRRSTEAARARFEASEADLAAARLAVAAETTTVYLRLRGLDREIAIVDRSVRLRESNLELVQKRLTAGSAGQIDEFRSRALLESARADREDLWRQRALAEHALAVLLGEAAPAFALAVSTANELTPPMVPVGLPATLLERRPDIAAAERALIARNAEIGVARAAFFPSISLNGSAGLASAELGDLLQSESHLWSFGPALRLPIFEGGRNVRRLEAARARYAADLSAYRASILVAYREVQDALADLHWLGRREQHLDAATVAARAAADLELQRYEGGRVSLFEVVDADRTALANELESTRNRTRSQLATVALVRALGGGWSDLRP
jgi:multidrug efflux system outer membrane protein